MKEGTCDLRTQPDLGGCSPIPRSPARGPIASDATAAAPLGVLCPLQLIACAVPFLIALLGPVVTDPIQSMALLLIAVLKIPAWFLMRAGASGEVDLHISMRN